ncbi:hypothetical protein BpHYR1_038563 [Brachionus plicatilis]|uniref:Uncharacterized protein n=1 Tax=Brachionus plicatilis TaxID=10195 RepID=A0A3M7PLD2_BRAPC|nr:hypothetical protein BpHYR1_038563 [Brachionus plicatilis]
MIAFPTSVAPKNVQNFTKKWPQVIPAKSKSGLGIEAHNKMPMNPTFLIILKTLNLILSSILSLIEPSFSASNKCSNSSSSSLSDPSLWWLSLPERAAARAIKYGGSSPMAVPAPHMKDSRRTLDIMDKMVIKLEEVSVEFGQMMSSG